MGGQRIPDPGSTVTFFHVTASANQESIDQHGLDWKRMGAATGIAGSVGPEQEGCFLCRGDWEADWFVRMGSHWGPVDMWAVVGIEESELLESPEGHYFVPFAIPRSQLTLVRKNLRDESRPWIGPSEKAAVEDRLQRYRRRS